MADRQLYIIPADDDPADHVDAAVAAGCSEIVQGIPPALDDLVDEADLPCAHHESCPDNGTGLPELSDVRSSIENTAQLSEPVREALLATLDAIEAEQTPAPPEEP